MNLFALETLPFVLRCFNRTFTFVKKLTLELIFDVLHDRANCVVSKILTVMFPELRFN